jgi:hypothetical protein
LVGPVLGRRRALESGAEASDDDRLRPRGIILSILSIVRCLRRVFGCLLSGLRGLLGLGRRRRVLRPGGPAAGGQR